MLKKFMGLFLLISTAQAFDGFLPYETTRLKGLAGAGSASLMVNEAVILNPAAIVFTNQSTFLYEKGSVELDEGGDQRSGDFKSGNTESVILTDVSNAVKGGLGYFYQRGNQGKKVSYNASLAAPISKRSALGFIVSHNEEESFLYPDKTYTQIDAGYTLVLTESLVLAATMKDATFVNPEYHASTLGVFYTLNEFIDVMGDIGTGDMQNKEKKSFNKWALQIQSFNRLYLRYGRFHDQNFGFKGTAYGLSWVGPKFSLDYAYKTSEKIGGSTDRIIQEDIITETSIGLTTLF